MVLCFTLNMMKFSASFKEHVLNNYWAKLPDLLNNILEILIRFRENQVVLLRDIRKSYHVVKIPIIDQHANKFLWREMQTNQMADVYAVTFVSLAIVLLVI